MDAISSSIPETIETVASVVAPSNAQTQLLQKMLHFSEPLDTFSIFDQTGNSAPGPSVLQRQMSVQLMELETPVHSIPANTSISSTPIASSSAIFDPEFIPWTTIQKKWMHWCAVCEGWL